ncbi:hypothetical protein F4776DRAFT_612822 [Hypoxylon sp. NC0597]|nr:hypothetical protein F4776DRAFT_612822 [Hypoxylon sp. NC0597]
MQLHTVALDKSAAKVDDVLSRSGSRLNPLTSCSRASHVGTFNIHPSRCQPRHRRFV